MADPDRSIVEKWSQDVQCTFVAPSADELVAYLNDVRTILVAVEGNRGAQRTSRIRANGCAAPVLAIADRDDDTDPAQLLDAGADDLVFRPLDALVWRTRASLLTGIGRSGYFLRSEGGGPLWIQPHKHEVWVEGRLVSMRPAEYAVLLYLVRRSDRIVTKREICQNVLACVAADGTVRNQIYEIRAKLGQLGWQDLVVTVPRAGYRFNPDARRQI